MLIHQRSRGVSALMCWLLICIAGLCVQSMSFATAWTWGNDNKPARWPENKKITFWVPPSVHNGIDRAPFVREGIMRWRAEMLTRNITINVPNQAPQPTTTNVVNVTFEPPGTSLPDDERAELKLSADGYPRGIGGCTVTGPPLEITAGKIILVNNLGASTEAEKEFLRNLGAHEVTHVLGLGDDANGKVTKSTHGTTPETFNEQDLKEIGTLYPKNEQPVPKGQAQPGGGGLTRVGSTAFPYIFSYTGPPDGHVPLIVLYVEASVIDSVLCPPGWVCLDPRDPLCKDLSHPYYAEYMTSGVPSQAPWMPGVKVPLAFRALTPDVELSPANPMIALGLTADNFDVGPIRIWSGEEFQILPGPVPKQIPGDVNGDGVVNVSDLLAVIGAWGQCPQPCPPSCAADFNDDCLVNVTDLLTVIANWG